MSLTCRDRRRKCAARYARQKRAYLIFIPALSIVAFSKDAFPSCPRRIAPARPKSSARYTKPRLSRVNLQAQYQAFVRFAVASSAALSAIALDRTCLLEPFTRAGSRAENSGLHPHPPAGPGTLDRCCGRNVVAPEGYSKRFFKVQSGFTGAFSGP